MTLGGIDRRSSTSSAFGKYFERSGNTKGRMSPIYRFSKGSINRESLYNILIEFGVLKI